METIMLDQIYEAKINPRNWKGQKHGLWVWEIITHKFGPDICSGHFCNGERIGFWERKPITRTIPYIKEFYAR